MDRAVKEVIPFHQEPAAKISCHPPADLDGQKSYEEDRRILERAPDLRVMAHGVATYTEHAEDQKSHEYPVQFAKAYGALAGGMRPAPYLYTSPAYVGFEFDRSPDCNHSNKSTGYNLSAMTAFFDLERESFEKALVVLANNHPDIHPSNLRIYLMMYGALMLETYDDTDYLQDAAASDFLENDDLRETFQERFFEVDALFAPTWAGNWAWQAYSLVKGVPLEAQAVGPLQIKAELAMAAFQEPGLFESGYHKILNADDFRDDGAIIGGSFDPEKMFAYYAMSWDLALREIKRIEDFSLSGFSFPYFNSLKTRRELGLLEGAFDLVLNPDDAEEIPRRVISRMFSHLARIYLIGDLALVAPQLEGITSRVSASGFCEEGAMSYYYHYLSPETTCLYKTQN